MIAIVDYGAGNLASVKKAFEFVGANVAVTDEPARVASADKIVLPGVGHFSALGALDAKGLRVELLRAVRAGTPVLGICLGLQWLFEGSEEAPQFPGAAILQGKCRKFPASVKAPHVGWNSLALEHDARLLRGVKNGAFVYYTHSFYAPVVAATAAASEHGLPFSAAVEHKNVFGVQFHPEKSADVGLRILKNFCEV